MLEVTLRFGRQTIKYDRLRKTDKKNCVLACVMGCSIILHGGKLVLLPKMTADVDIPSSTQILVQLVFANIGDTIFSQYCTNMCHHCSGFPNYLGIDVISRYCNRMSSTDKNMLIYY